MVQVVCQELIKPGFLCSLWSSIHCLCKQRVVCLLVLDSWANKQVWCQDSKPSRGLGQPQGRHTDWPWLCCCVY